MDSNSNASICPMTEQMRNVEAVLFAVGDPAPASHIAECAGIDKAALPQLTEKMNEFYTAVGSSLIVLTLGSSYQLAVRREYFDIVKNAIDTQKNQPLSQAAMEALTIIAYNQPVTKQFVENVRGVDSSSVVNSLVQKGLLAEAGRLDLPGRPVAYKTTEVFLRSFGLQSLDDLPPLPHKKEAEQEAEEVIESHDI